jgi:hypothetical protein
MISQLQDEKILHLFPISFSSISSSNREVCINLFELKISLMIRTKQSVTQ